MKAFMAAALTGVAATAIPAQAGAEGWEVFPIAAGAKVSDYRFATTSDCPKPEEDMAHLCHLAIATDLDRDEIGEVVRAMARKDGHGTALVAYPLDGSTPYLLATWADPMWELYYLAAESGTEFELVRPESHPIPVRWRNGQLELMTM